MYICPELGQFDGIRRVLPDAIFTGAEDIPLRGCTDNPREVRSGDLFVAISSKNRDKTAHWDEVIGRGCIGIVTDGEFTTETVPVCRVNNAREAYGRLCHALAGKPSDLLRVVGAAGSSGTSTTACLIAGILSHAGMKSGLIGSIGHFDGEAVENSSRATPPADRLASHLSKMVRNECTHAVLEISDLGLTRSRIAGIDFDAICLTEIAKQQKKAASNEKKVTWESATIFDSLRSDGFVVFNADDPNSREIAQKWNGPALSVGINMSAEVQGTPVEEFASEQTFLISAGSDTIPVRTAMVGRRHLYRCLEATAVGLMYGIPLTSIVRSIEKAAYIPGRLERIECGQPFSVFVDIARTPESLKEALETVRSVAFGRVICVFGAEGERNRTSRSQLGEVVGAVADRSIITSVHPRHENPQTIIREVLDGMQEHRTAESIVDRKAAIHRALSIAQPGDAVLLAGKGHELFQVVGKRRLAFDDREIARRWLQRYQPFSEI